MTNVRNERLLEQYRSHPLRKQFESAFEASELFAAARARIQRNADLSESGRSKQIESEARSALLDILDARQPLEAMRSKVAAMKAGVKAPALDPSTAMLRAELRAAIKQMDPGDRVAALLDDAEMRDAVLEQHPLVSGVSKEIFDRLQSARLEMMFATQLREIESLEQQIEDAAAIIQISRDDVKRELELRDDAAFEQFAAPIEAKRGAVWLKRDGDKVVVVRIGETHYPEAGPDDLRFGKFYEDKASYDADRAVA